MRYSKYGARKAVSIDGTVFDSRKEMRRWNELTTLAAAGEITDLERQVKYILIPAQREPDIVGPRGGRKQGKLIEREVAYFADFRYIDKDGKVVVEDAKGMRTKEYIVKRKLMLYIHGIKVIEV